MGHPVGMRSAHELVRWLHSHDGVGHTTALRAAGFTTHGIRSILADRRAEWVRRSWLALPDAHPQVRFAAALGGRLTCLSAAALSGLWTPAHTETHVVVAPTSARVNPAGARVHWAPGPAPGSATAVREPPVNVLFHVAGCVPLADALAVWESAIRKGLADAAELARVAWRAPAARQLASVASELSDSGIETRFVALMRSIGVAVRQQVWMDGHPVDGLIGERLVVQLDGFAHHQAADRRRDLRADARLVLRGYTVLRFDYVQVLFHPEEVIAAVSMAIAQGLHRAPARR